VQDGDERHRRASLRNLRPALATRILFGSYGFCEHGTQHEHPAIPHYRLSAFTRASAAERPGLAYRLTYWSVLRNAIF
jgi:fatty acid desaturase